MNLAEQFNPCPKPSFGRGKLKRSQRSELSAKEDQRLKERSNGVCEKCDRARATERAHIERRWKSEGKPTAEQFAHLCTPCHRYCDGSADGRDWLKTFQERLRKHASTR